MTLVRDSSEPPSFVCHHSDHTNRLARLQFTDNALPSPTMTKSNKTIAGRAVGRRRCVSTSPDTLEAPTESQIGSRCRPHTALLRRAGSSSTTISNCGRSLIGSVVTSDKSVGPGEPAFCITQGSAVALGKCCNSNLDVRMTRAKRFNKDEGRPSG